MSVLTFTVALISSWICSSLAFSPTQSNYARTSQEVKMYGRIDSSSSADCTRACDLCIIGGGISGLSAAITAAASQSKASNIILLESQPTPGGRVSSDIMNGYTFDRGYAVFIEQYPKSKEIFDYAALGLKAYEPGALIKVKNGGLARVADPLRQPSKLVDALVTPVGKAIDKLRLAPLFFHVKTNTVEELFEEEETDTLFCLKERYNFSDKMIQEFFEPFLTGIYFSPLDQQSSRMFHFVFKMFADGAATLPTGGMQAVSDQLMNKAIGLGVDVRLNDAVSGLKACEDGYQIETKGGPIRSNSVICATEGVIAEKLLCGMQGLESIGNFDEQPQRSVGCMYYTFRGETPVKDAVLILNGEGVNAGPALTVSFPHIVNDAYAPENRGLCSVSIPGVYMEEHEGRQNDLDEKVRRQLADWWPDYRDDITNKWSLEKTYHIRHAQPGQLFGPQPANRHGGRSSSELRGVTLPRGLFVCGDYMATATLNGAIESGMNAAEDASSYIAR